MKAFNITIIAAALVFFFCPLIKAQTDKKVLTLVQNKPIELEIAAGETHSCEIKADKEQFLQVVIDQKSADVAVALIFASGRKLLAVDNPNIKRGPEHILFITPAAGTYRLEITSKENGRYAAKIETFRAAAPQDRNRIEAERAFIDGEILSAAESHAQALVKYEEAFRLINGFGDSFGEATILYGLGKTHNSMGDKEKAADHFRKARTLFQNAGSWDEVFKELGPLYLLMGGKQKTFDYLSGALPLVRALKNLRLEAILLTGLSKISEDLSKQQQALDLNLQALELFRITGKRGAEVFTLTEISDGDLTLEEKNKAMGYLNQALLLSQGASDKGLEASLLVGIGYIYGSIGEHENALSYYRRTLPLWRQLKDKNGEAYSLSFIGSAFYVLGDFLSARDNLETSITLVRQTGDRRAEAYAISYLGAIEDRLGDPQKALERYQTALKIFQETGDRHGEASEHSYLAQVYWNKGDTSKALENYQRSLSIWRGAMFREGEALVLSNLGFIYGQTGETEKSLTNHEQALGLFRLQGNRSGEASSLYGVARVLYTRGNLDEARTKIESAIELIESLRSKITSSELRATYLATHQHIYKFYIELLMRLDKEKPSQGFAELALKASERARARSLLDILNEARTDIRHAIDPTLAERERSLQKQLGVMDRQRSAARDPLRIESLDKEIRTLTTAYQELQAEIRQKSPQYAALTQPQPLDVKDIQQMLDPETLLLEYSLGQTESYLWLVSQDSLKVFRLPKQADIEAKARTFYEAVKKKETFAQAQKAASELGIMLISPAASELGNKRLAIVADGVLGYVPFAAMTLANSAAPLINDHEIVYLPSASALASLRSSVQPKSATKALAVFADPVFDANDTRVGRDLPGIRTDHKIVAKITRDAGITATLPRLPGTRNEATTILSFVPESDRKSAVGFDANITSARNPGLAQYRIIHFATHGILNSVHPELSGIVLSLVNEQGKPQDGFLRLNEIYNLNLPADLVVLSACQTALGKEIRGEGLIGLTRGFMYAGSRRIVASQWAVDDQATSELMRLFYQGMLGDKKLRPAAALREAQIAMIKTRRFSSPYYWSAFTIQGEWK